MLPALSFCVSGASLRPMIRTAVAAATLLLAVPATAQSEQDRLDARYDRALAAGYKALMLCSAIANAERNNLARSPQSVEQWELTGIQAPLDAIIRDLPYEIVRGAPIEFRSPKHGFVRHVEVTWAADMPPRLAEYRGTDGCAPLPIGTQPQALRDQTAGFRRLAPEVSPYVDRENRTLQAAGMTAFGDGYGKRTRTSAVIVSQNDRIKFEAFAEGFGRNTPQRTWSVAKSIAATLVGMAVHNDAVRVTQSAGVGLDEVDPRSEITIDDMLRMASGRYSDTPGNRTDPIYWGGATVDERARTWPLINPPGTVFRYANNDTLMAVEAIQPWLEQRDIRTLADQIGMFNIAMESDWKGNRVLSSQVWASAADLLALGQFYLDDGVRWRERYLPEGWMKYVSAPAGPQPDGEFGYGAGWWLMNKSEGVPADTIAAVGNRGQYVVIVPSRNVVIVRRGEDPVGARFDIAAFTRDVLTALTSE